MHNQVINEQLITTNSNYYYIPYLYHTPENLTHYYTTPCPNMASATFTKPAIFAPLT